MVSHFLPSGIKFILEYDSFFLFFSKGERGESVSASPKDLLCNRGIIISAKNFALPPTLMNWYIVYKGNAYSESLAERLDKANIEHYEPKRIVETYDKEKAEVVKREDVLISNLIFIHTSDNIYRIIERFAGLNCPYIDHMTHRPAMVSHQEMQRFITSVEEAYHSKADEPILLEHPFNYFSNHTKVKVMAGPLAGQMGYVVRIRNDRKLVISFGKMAVAVSGIHRRMLVKIDDTEMGGVKLVKYSG